MKNNIFVLAIIAMVLASCTDTPTTPPQNNNQPLSSDEESKVKVYYGDFDVPKPNPEAWAQFDHLFAKDTNYVNEHGLAPLSNDFYKDWQPSSTLPTNSKMIANKELEVHFYPLNQDTTKYFQYVHEYKCSYDLKKDGYHAQVAYPSPCSGKKQKAKVVLTNKSPQSKTYKCRLFYQNNSYWFSTGLDADFKNRLFLQNYYGGSEVKSITVAPNTTKTFTIDYQVGMNPKGNSIIAKSYYGPARPGAYEFMLWVTEDANDPLIQDWVDYVKINPFAYYSEQVLAGNESVKNRMAHVHAKHFKFIPLKETFSRARNYQPGNIFHFGNRDQKKLCDTCSGYFKDVITDKWTTEDFFEGFIHDADWVKAPYGNRKENVRIDENGIYLRTPKSTPEQKQKTWGEVKFMPAILYGTVRVVAKLSQLRNPSKTPTGIVHNIWLYQHNPDKAPPIKDHPYAHLTNSRKQQPYEIDIEVWSQIYEENWGGGSMINYSIVDYMRDANVWVKPNEEKTIEGHKVDRSNKIQLNYPQKDDLLRRDFFDQYHLFEIQWNPYDIYYKVDGKIKAKIDWRMAKIPDRYAFLWIGSPIYQDGTYYAQNQIPFLPYDAFTHIRYISIE